MFDADAPIVSCESSWAHVGDRNVFVRCKVRARPKLTAIFCVTTAISSDGHLLDPRRQRDDGDRGSSGQRALDARDGRYRRMQSSLPSVSWRDARVYTSTRVHDGICNERKRFRGAGVAYSVVLALRKLHAILYSREWLRHYLRR